MSKYHHRRDNYDILAGRDPKDRGHTPPRDVEPLGSVPLASTLQDEEDRILIQFLKGQPPGIVRNEAFQRLAEQVRLSTISHSPSPMRFYNVLFAAGTTP